MIFSAIRPYSSSINVTIFDESFANTPTAVLKINFVKKNYFFIDLMSGNASAN